MLASSEQTILGVCSSVIISLCTALPLNGTTHKCLQMCAAICLQMQKSINFSIFYLIFNYALFKKVSACGYHKFSACIFAPRVCSLRLIQEKKFVLVLKVRFTKNALGMGTLLYSILDKARMAQLLWCSG